METLVNQSDSFSRHGQKLFGEHVAHVNYNSNSGTLVPKTISLNIDTPADEATSTPAIRLNLTYDLSNDYFNISSSEVKNPSAGYTLMEEAMTWLQTYAAEVSAAQL